MRLHVRNIAYILGLELEHGKKREDYAGSNIEHGLYVSSFALHPVDLLALTYCRASTAVVVRMAFLMDLKKDDFLFNTIDVAIWSDIEQGLAITAGSLATLRPLYRLITERLGLSQSATEQLNHHQTSREWYQSRSNHKTKRSGPFSLMTLTLHNQPSRMHSPEFDDGSTLRIRDDLIEDSQDTEFQSWRIQTGSDGELGKEIPDRGISRQTDVYLVRH